MGNKNRALRIILLVFISGSINLFSTYAMEPSNADEITTTEMPDEVYEGSSEDLSNSDWDYFYVPEDSTGEWTDVPSDEMAAQGAPENEYGLAESEDATITPSDETDFADYDFGDTGEELLSGSDSIETESLDTDQASTTNETSEVNDVQSLSEMGSSTTDETSESTQDLTDFEKFGGLTSEEDWEYFEVSDDEQAPSGEDWVDVPDEEWASMEWEDTVEATDTELFEEIN